MSFGTIGRLIHSHAWILTYFRCRLTSFSESEKYIVYELYPSKLIIMMKPNICSCSWNSLKYLSHAKYVCAQTSIGRELVSIFPSHCGKKINTRVSVWFLPEQHQLSSRATSLTERGLTGVCVIFMLGLLASQDPPILSSAWRAGQEPRLSPPLPARGSPRLLVTHHKKVSGILRRSIHLPGISFPVSRSLQEN